MRRASRKKVLLLELIIFMFLMYEDIEMTDFHHMGINGSDSLFGKANHIDEIEVIWGSKLKDFLLMTIFQSFLMRLL